MNKRISKGPNKQPLIDKILLQTPVPKQLLVLFQRGIIVRNGPDIFTNWVWNAERLPYYELKDLEDILVEATKPAE